MFSKVTQYLLIISLLLVSFFTIAQVKPTPATERMKGMEQRKALENKLPKPQAILEYEKKNSGKKKVKVRDGRTGG